MTRAASFRAREAFISPSASVASSRWFAQAAVWMCVHWTHWPQLRWDSECGSRQLHPRTQ
uniref:Uncharacterized protein n=1 Tax=Xiphophorus couchianus TaxID=32473 RepID=A0A3B5LAM9_9TELE